MEKVWGGRFTDLRFSLPNIIYLVQICLAICMNFISFFRMALFLVDTEVAHTLRSFSINDKLKSSPTKFFKIEIQFCFYKT